MLDLPAGRTGHVSGTTVAGRSGDVNLYSDHGRWLSLECWSVDPPRDRWRSIAETFAFLPASQPDASRDADTTPDTWADSLVLQDATGDLSGFATLEPTGGPAYTDLTGLTVMLDGETLSVRFDVAGAVPEAPDPTDTTVYYFLAIDTDGDHFPNFHLDIGSEDGWTASLFDYDAVAITRLGAAIVADASLTGSVPLADLGSPTELRVQAWMEASQHPDPSGDPQDVTRWTDRVPDDPTEWAALGASTP